jgi:hypothetical protein
MLPVAQPTHRRKHELESSPSAAARVPDAIAEELSTGTRTPDSTPHASRKNSRELFATPQVQVWFIP